MLASSAEDDLSFNILNEIHSAEKERKIMYYNYLLFQYS